MVCDPRMRWASARSRHDAHLTPKLMRVCGMGFLFLSSHMSAVGAPVPVVRRRFRFFYHTRAATAISQTWKTTQSGSSCLIVSSLSKQRQGRASTIRKDLVPKYSGVRLNAEVSGCKCGVFRNRKRLSAKSFISCRRRTCGTAHGSRNRQPRKTSAAGHESVHAHPCRPAMRRPFGGQRRKPLPRLSTSPQVRSN
jgi:hypothetical protein